MLDTGPTAALGSPFLPTPDALVRRFRAMLLRAMAALRAPFLPTQAATLVAGGLELRNGLEHGDVGLLAGALLVVAFFMAWVHGDVPGVGDLAIALFLRLRLSSRWLMARMSWFSTQPPLTVVSSKAMVHSPVLAYVSPGTPPPLRSGRSRASCTAVGPPPWRAVEVASSKCGSRLPLQA